jgi:hypothetical protein
MPITPGTRLGAFEILAPLHPLRGVQTAPPFAVQHFHDPQRLLISTPFGSGIVKDAFIYDQYETTASIWLLGPRRPSPARD